MKRPQQNASGSKLTGYQDYTHYLWYQKERKKKRGRKKESQRDKKKTSMTSVPEKEQHTHIHSAKKTHLSPPKGMSSQVHLALNA